MTAAEKLAAFASRLRWSDVPPAIREQLKLHVLDTLGVICAGVRTPEASAARGAYERWAGAAESTVIGARMLLPAPNAAFLNALAGRVHTFDDTYEDGPVHPGSVAVSSALASAERAGTSGTDFLVAALVGYETTVRVSSALGPSHYAAGFHNTGTCNVFGACVAAGRARGLDETAFADAIGLAGETAAGFRQYQIDGGMIDTALNGANAARNGVTAVELQQCGLRGPHGILDGRFGLARVTAQGEIDASAWEDLGERYAFAKTTLKPYPSCRFTHGPIEALTALRAEHGLQADDIESVEIATFRESIEVSDKPAFSSRVDAILSHQYTAARVLRDGSFALADLEAQRVAEPAVRELAGRIRVTLDPTLQAAYPAEWPHRITVTLRDKRRLVTESRNPPGADRVPEKVMALAAPLLGEERARRAIELVQHLEDLDRIGELTCVLH